jgi:hypothetical protein
MPLVNLDAVRHAHERFLEAHDDMVSGILYETGLAIVGEVVLHPGFHPRTGKLQAATTTRVVRARGGKTLRIKNTKPYAWAIEYGSRAHVIRAREAKTLRFIGRDGNWTFRKSVRHPGTRPYRFLSRATGIGYDRAGHMLTAGMQRVARRFGMR